MPDPAHEPNVPTEALSLPQQAPSLAGDEVVLPGASVERAIKLTLAGIDDVTSADIAELLISLSDFHRASGGLGLHVVIGDTFATEKHGIATEIHLYPICVHSLTGDRAEIDAEIAQGEYEDEFHLLDHAIRIALQLLGESQHAELNYWKLGETEQVPHEELLEQMRAPEELHDDYLPGSDESARFYYIESPQLLELQQRLGLESTSQAVCYSLALLLCINEYLRDGWTITTKTDDEFVPIELPAKDQKLS